MRRKATRKEETNMIGRRVIAAAAFAIAVTGGIAAAQGQGERVFTFRSGATGKCPLLDWHLVVEPDHDVFGMVAWNNDMEIMRVTGKLDLHARTFSLAAAEVGGTRTATIDGSVISPDHIVVNIKANGQECQNMHIWSFKKQSGGG
jgi:hypothetical protein